MINGKEVAEFVMIVLKKLATVIFVGNEFVWNLKERTKCQMFQAK
jgi:hypothetical protein